MVLIVVDTTAAVVVVKVATEVVASLVGLCFSYILILLMVVF